MTPIYDREWGKTVLWGFMFQGRSDFELEKSTTDIMRLKNVGKGRGNDVQNVQNRNFPTKTLSLNEVV